MPIVGYGYDQTIKPGYQANLQNVDLIAKVLLTKQNEFDTAYAGMKDLQKQALGINFLNKKEQSKIDSFNKEVNDAFAAGEFGDLSQGKVADRYFAMFDKIGNDTTLVSRYRQDSAYQKMVRDVESKRMSKDPAKAGFGQINYENFLGRLNEYSQMDLDSPMAEGYALRPYTEFVDINKELGDRMKDVPIKKFSVPEVKNGYVVTKVYEGRDPDAVKAQTAEYMAGRGAAQIREQAEYTFRRAQNDPNFQQAIYSDHVAYNQRAQAQIKTELDKVQEDLKGSQDPAQIKELADKQARLEGEMSKLQTTLKSADEYFSRDSGEIINDISSIALQDLIESSGTSFGGYAVTTKIEPDRAYLEVAKMQQHAEEFKINTQLKMQEMQQEERIAQAKINADKGTSDSSTSTGATGMPPGAPTPSYFSTSDPTYVDYGSTVDAITATVTKAYAQKANILRDGITHGDNPWSGEQTTLELLINDKALNDNPYYGGNPYLQAFQIARDELYTKDRALAEYIGKRPTDNYSWDRLKEAGAKVQARVDEIMTRPKNKKEAALMNQLQDTNANLLSMEEFLAEANKSGNPYEFIRNSPLIKMYPNAVYDFELPENASKEAKAKQAQMETTFRPTFENLIDNPIGDYNSKMTNVAEGEWNAQWNDPLKVRNIPFGQVRKVETGPDGTLKVFMKDAAFQTVTKGEDIDPAKSGVFSMEGRYMMVKGPDGKYSKVTKEQIQSKGYFELKDDRFNKLNFSNQLGFSVGAKPQKRWDASTDGVSVPFETRMSTLTGKVQASIAGGTWIEYPTSDVSAVITQVRSLIGSAKYSEILGQFSTTPTSASAAPVAPAPQPQQ